MKEFIYSTEGIILTAIVERLYMDGYSNFQVQEWLNECFDEYEKERDEETDQWLDAADMLHYNLERNNGKYNMNEKPFIE